MKDEHAAKNTDTVIWRESDDFGSPKISVTENDGIRLHVGGNVITFPIERWHQLGQNQIFPSAQGEKREIGVTFVCAHCGSLAIQGETQLDSGTNLVCAECGKSTVVNLQTSDDYAEGVMNRHEQERLEGLLRDVADIANDWAKWIRDISEETMDTAPGCRVDFQMKWRLIRGALNRKSPRMSVRKMAIEIMQGIRNVQDPCPECNGSGVRSYPDTTTWDDREGIGGGQAFTIDVCDVCWGTGDSRRTGKNLREALHRRDKLESIVGQLVESSEECPFCDTDVCAERCPFQMACGYFYGNETNLQE